MSILILSDSSMIQNHAFGDGMINFGVLASTYTNTLPGTSISGDLGYTMSPELPSTVNGVIHVADSVYSQAGDSTKYCNLFCKLSSVYK